MPGSQAGTGALVGERLGSYDVVALLAVGGTAEIYLARMAGEGGFEKYVVVKCLHDHLAFESDFVDMFLDEARLGSHLDHSNIVQTLELGQHHGRYYLVMEFLAGLSLSMMARRAGERLPDGRLPVHLSLGIIAQACAGLHYAHERVVGGVPLGLVHRDVSPQNLVVSFEGVVKIVDFGIAKAELRETKTRTGTIKGKFAYMAPEQCLARNVDRRTDVFALGVILHELLTGRRLFKRASAYDTYQAILECKVPPPSAVCPDLDATIDTLVLRALAQNREQRYPTADALGESIVSYLHERGAHFAPGDISRFLDQHFQPELDEHAERMREIMAGHEGAPELMSWDSDAESGLVDREIISESGPLAEKLDAAALDPVSVLDDVVDTLEEGAEATRIEANPLGQVREPETHRGEAERAGSRVPTGAAGGPGGKAPRAPGGIDPRAPAAAQAGSSTGPTRAVMALPSRSGRGARRGTGGQGPGSRSSGTEEVPAMPEVPQVATRSPQGATRSPQGKRRSGIFSSPTPLGSPQAATPPGAGRAPESGRPPEPFLAYVPTVIAPKGAAPPVRRTPQQAPAKASPVPAATSARRAGTAPPDARTAVLQVDPPAVPDVIREERSASPPAAAFGASPDAVRTIIGRDAGPLPPAAAVPDATESERPASASGNIELSLPAYLMNLSSVSFDTDGSPEPWQPVKSVTQRRTVTYVRSMAAGRPWILPVLFVLTVSIALGVTVAIVRVLAW